jgi:hypothetical protein
MDLFYCFVMHLAIFEWVKNVFTMSRIDKLKNKNVFLGNEFLDNAGGGSYNKSKR